MNEEMVDKTNEGESRRWHFDVSQIGETVNDESTTEHDDIQQQNNTAPANQSPEPETAQPPMSCEDGESGETNKTEKPTRNTLKKAFLKKGLIRYVPWLAMIVCCLLVLIYNRYRIEDLVKEKNDTEERIKYLREHRIQMQKKYQESTKISKVAEELDTVGIGLLSGPPYEL